MSSITSRIRDIVSSAQCVIGYEPAVRPNFANADYFTIAAIIFALIMKGVDTASGIHTYLSRRGCEFDRDTVQFLLTIFDGDDGEYNLWFRDKADHYVVLI